MENKNRVRAAERLLEKIGGCQSEADEKEAITELHLAARLKTDLRKKKSGSDDGDPQMELPCRYNPFAKANTDDLEK